MQKKKILFLVDKMENGGAERQMLKIASLYSNDYEIEVTSLLLASTVMLDKIKELKFTYIPLQNKKFSGSLIRLVQLYQSYRALKKVIKNDNYYAVFSFLEWSNILSFTAISSCKKSDQIQLYLNVRNYLSNQYGSKGNTKLYLAKKILTRFYNQANAVICNSNAIKQDLVTNFGINENKVRVIYNSIDLKKIKADSAVNIDSQITKDENLTFITCGRLVDQKQVHSLLLSFHEYNMLTNRNDRLLILGDGEQKLTLINCINKNQINAQLLGNKDNVAAWLYNADCFLLNSYFEGFPNALAEAISLGTFSIVADCLSGPREIMTNFELVDYEKELSNVYKTPLGVLYKSQSSVYEINPYLVDALKQSVQAIKSHSRDNIKTQLQDEKFGVLQWHKMLN